MRRNRIKFHQCSFDITTCYASSCGISAFRNSSKKKKSVRTFLLSWILCSVRTCIHIVPMFSQSDIETSKKGFIMKQTFYIRHFDLTGFPNYAQKRPIARESGAECRSRRCGGKSHVTDRNPNGRGSRRSHSLSMRLARKAFGSPLRSRIRAR